MSSKTTCAVGLSFCTFTVAGTGALVVATKWLTLTVYSPATMPRMVTISSRIGEAIFLPLTTMKSLAPAAVVAVEHQKARLAMAIPCDVARRILHEQIKIVRMAVRPIHGDDEFGFRVDLAVLGLRRYRQEREEKEKRDHLQRLEQHDAEGIERLFARVEAELIDHARIARSWARSKAGTTRVSVSVTARENTFAVALSSM